MLPYMLLPENEQRPVPLQLLPQLTACVAAVVFAGELVVALHTVYWIILSCRYAYVYTMRAAR